MNESLRKRLLVGGLLASAVTALFVLDGWLSTLRAPWWPVEVGPWRRNASPLLMNGLISATLIATLIVAGTRELIAFARSMGYRPLAGVAYFFAAALVFAPFIAGNVGLSDRPWDGELLALALGVAFLAQAIRSRTEHVMANVATTLLIVFYTGGLAGFVVKLRMDYNSLFGQGAGVTAILFTIAIVKLTDTGAFFIGGATGRHKMIPWLSPKKTWEGFAGGLLTAVALSVVGGSLLQGLNLPPFDDGLMSTVAGQVAFGLLMGLLSTAGDLCASLLKRDAAVKDSGQALPGLGGVIDVLDSPLIAAPVAYVFWTRLVFHLG